VNTNLGELKMGKTTEEKCADILKHLVQETREELGEYTENEFSLGWDWGDWTLTIRFPDGTHTHVGDPTDGGTFNALIDQLYDLLVHGRGLSRA
jgi:hypothetical protein